DARVEQLDDHRLVGLDHEVVRDGHCERLYRLVGIEGQCPRRQRVVLRGATSSIGGAADDMVLDRGPAAGPGAGDGDHGGRGALGHRVLIRAELHGAGDVLAVDGERGGALDADGGRGTHAADLQSDGLVRLGEGVVDDRDREGGGRRAAGKGHHLVRERRVVGGGRRSAAADGRDQGRDAGRQTAGASERDRGDAETLVHRVCGLIELDGASLVVARDGQRGRAWRAEHGVVRTRERQTDRLVTLQGEVAVEGNRYELGGLPRTERQGLAGGHVVRGAGRAGRRGAASGRELHRGRGAGDEVGRSGTGHGHDRAAWPVTFIRTEGRAAALQVRDRIGKGPT